MVDQQDYEPLSPDRGWRIPLIVAGVALLALFGTQRFYRYEPPEPIPPASARSEPAPARLADGSALPQVPDEVAARFNEPVVMTRSVDALPARIARRCTTAQLPAGLQHDKPVRQRVLQQLVDRTEASAIRVGPDVLTTLRLGRAASPPGYPRTYQQSCVAVFDDVWRAGRPLLHYVLDNGPSAPGPGRRNARVASVVLTVPDGARWALHERPGWWLGLDVEQDSHVQVALRPARRRAPLRVVFLDGSGRVVEDRTVERPGRASPRWRAHRMDEQLVVGPVRQVLRRLERRPLHVCSTNERLCVWLTRSGNDLYAAAAFGPHRLDSPPFGYVGYCPASNSLQGTTSDSRFSRDGRWAGGPSPHGLVTYRVSYDATERVVVDLARVEQPAPRRRGGPSAVRGAVCTFGQRLIGTARG